ncbi:hypothetical protein CIHG_03261 [Coccidioides immitis H538.4]|uniref:Uncharacterized protein n=3 Tax=Coccidioides immitis TaxID=5501 RepID=A0A0J8QTZ9_COCIT|nr:hypothetical protein CIRG_00956 [Coccidioides immitis RMSCC 2394]KMU75530.1 hypothetical protein CISG_04933 [Coccidioides immitis RMSCC 3703]KMU85479.1 hypothetical protein CIHG_03261 [Coccidioides immitis H538.4]
MEWNSLVIFTHAGTGTDESRAVVVPAEAALPGLNEWVLPAQAPHDAPLQHGCAEYCSLEISHPSRHTSWHSRLMNKGRADRHNCDRQTQGVRRAGKQKVKVSIEDIQKASDLRWLREWGVDVYPQLPQWHSGLRRPLNAGQAGYQYH